MKRLMAVSVVALAVAATGCSTRVSPGYVGVKVVASGTQRGVQDYPIVTGRVWYNPVNETVLEYPTFVQTAVWTRNVGEGHPANEEITFTTGDQMSVAADISLAYKLTADKVPAFYVMFRNDDIDRFTHGFLRNLAREKFDNAAGKYRIEQIMGDNAAFLREVREALQTDLKGIGIELQQFGFVGAPRPPQGVIDAINAKVGATQLAIQKQNELVQVQADAAKEVARAEGHARAVLAAADAEATSNRKISDSLSPNLVEWRKLERWDGKLPQMVGAGTPLITLK